MLVLFKAKMYVCKVMDLTYNILIHRINLILDKLMLVINNDTKNNFKINWGIRSK